MKQIIIKYLKGESNEKEEIELYHWLQKDKSNIEIFKEEIMLYMSKENSNNSSDDVQKAFESFKKEIERNTKKPILLIPYKTYYKYAAAILVVALASTYFLRDTIFNGPIENTTPIIVNNQIQPGSDKATLTLETGETIALEKGTAFQTQNASSNGEEIVYDAKNKTAEIAYNTLTIPRGGQFQITLADGTKVWLNSESQLKYPVSFADGKSREVELVYGEAYFDVSPSTAHKGSDFKVFNNQQEVQVLGTEFNIKAYKDETHIYTTLVEGKVIVKAGDNKQEIAPNQQFSYNINTRGFTLTTVDADYVLAWKRGVFNFENKSLAEIMTVLSRWYDMDVIFENKDLKQQQFIGSIKKSYNIEDILETFVSTHVINSYEVHGNKVVLK
jgi:hypothetical protein